MHLLSWLDFRHIWRGTATFCQCAVAYGILFAIGFEVVTMHRHIVLPHHMVAMPTPPPAATVSLPTIGTMFKGTQTSRKKETLAEAKRCLAQAIYFEARSEPVAGWEAVADVVINRARDSRYPASICGVVFQGEVRRHKCQFSFACDGRSDRARNLALWRRALRIAQAKLGHLRTLPQTATATHYHADYVTPYWSREMVRLAKIGRHIFYSDSAL